MPVCGAPTHTAASGSGAPRTLSKPGQQLRRSVDEDHEALWLRWARKGAHAFAAGTPEGDEGESAEEAEARSAQRAPKVTYKRARRG